MFVVIPLTMWAAWTFRRDTTDPAAGPGIDYYQFWLPGQAQAALHGANIYSPDTRDRLAAFGRARLDAAPSPRLAAAVQYRQRIETFSTPFLYAAVNVIATGNYDADLATFRIVGFAMAAGGIVLLCRMQRYRWDGALLLLAVVLIGSDPLLVDARVANVAEIQLGLVALYLWLLSRENDEESAWPDVLGGVVFGLVSAFKPTLAIVYVFLAIARLASRRWRPLAIQSASIVVTVAAAVAVSSWFLGTPQAWLDWLRAIPAIDTDANISVHIGNFSLARMVSESGGPDISVGLTALTIGAAALLAWRARQRHERVDRFEQDYLAIACGCAASAVVLRLVWLHYFVLTLPLAVVLLRGDSGFFWRRDRRVELVLAALAFVALLGRPLKLLAPPLSDYGKAAPYVIGAITLLVLGTIRLWARNLSALGERR